MLCGMAARSPLGTLRALVGRLLRCGGLAAGGEVARLETQIDALAGHATAVETGLTDAVRELQEWSTDQDRHIRHALTRTTDADRVGAASRAVPGMADFELEPFVVESSGRVLGYRGAMVEPDPGAAYLRFENTFRGSEELIRDRQRIYVPLLRDHRPVLDLGCGRGELLDLLRDASIPARGVDLDSAMVQRCREKGLEAELGDAVTTLIGLPEASVGAVIACQVIEHLPPTQLSDFLRSVRAALVPGGRLVLETVNPHAPQALKTFWVDVTHQHPLFPEVVLALCRMAGFPDAYVFYPGGQRDAEIDRFEVGDYAIVADAPAE